MAFKFYSEMTEWLCNEYHADAITCINNWIQCGTIENPEDYDQLWLALRENLQYDLWVGHWNPETQVIDVTQYMELTLDGVAVTIAGLTQPKELLDGCVTFMQNYFPIDRHVIIQDYRFTDKLVHLCGNRTVALYQAYNGALLYKNEHAFPLVAANYQQLKYSLADDDRYVIQELLYNRFGLQGELEAVSVNDYL